MAKSNFQEVRFLSGAKAAGNVVPMEVDAIDNTHYDDPAKFHEIQSQRRSKLASRTQEGLFEVTVAGAEGLLDPVSPAEMAAERLVTHVSLPIVDDEDRLISGFEEYARAVASGHKVISVLKIDARGINGGDIFAFQLRQAAKANKLPIASRVELLCAAVDTHRISPEVVRILLTNSRNKAPSLEDVKSEYKVGRLFEKRPNYRIPFTEFELNEKGISNLKYIVANREIYAAMQGSSEMEEHFLNMAIIASHKRQSRLQDELPRILEHEDTKRLLFERGLAVAKTELEAKYPEGNREIFPHAHVVAATETLQRADTRRMLAQQIENGPVTNPTMRQAREFVISFASLSPAAHRELAEVLYKLDPQAYLEVARLLRIGTAVAQ